MGVRMMEWGMLSTGSRIRLVSVGWCRCEVARAELAVQDTR